jgi:hypothetical protein
MVPHAVDAHEGPVEILTIFDHDGERAHLHVTEDDTRPAGGPRQPAP